MFNKGITLTLIFAAFAATFGVSKIRFINVKT
jgi:hypothetical protein